MTSTGSRAGFLALRFFPRTGNRSLPGKTEVLLGIRSQMVWSVYLRSLPVLSLETEERVITTRSLPPGNHGRSSRPLPKQSQRNECRSCAKHSAMQSQDAEPDDLSVPVPHRSLIISRSYSAIANIRVSTPVSRSVISPGFHRRAHRRRYALQPVKNRSACSLRRAG